MSRSRLGIASLLALALGGAGCYAPEIGDGTLWCAPPNDRCPRGFHCDPDERVCRRTATTRVNNEDGGTGGKPTDGSPNDGAADHAPDSDIGFGGSGLTGSGGNGGRITGFGGMGTGGMGTGGTPGAGIGGATGIGGRAGVGGAMVGTGGAGVGGSPVGTGVGGMGVGGRGVGGTPGTGGSGATDGTPCTSGTQCASTMCVDGFCCNQACNGQCQACDINLGLCTVVTSGQPHGTRGTCPGSNDACRSQCAGTPTQCGAFPDGNACTCTLGLDVGQCNGVGNCAVNLIGIGLMVCDSL